MDISVFCNLLLAEMVKMGVPEDKALKYMQSLKQNLTESDIAKVTKTDIPRYARFCADRVLMVSDKPNAVPAKAEPADPETTNDSSVTKPEETYTNETETVAENDHEILETVPDENKPSKRSSRGTRMLVLITTLTSPLWLVAAMVFFTPFIVLLTAEIALIAALICLLAGCTAAGTAASLTGIVYGIVKIFNSTAIGLYEIGFGVIIAGVSMILGILIYNGAVRLMPWVFKRSVKLVPLALSKIKPLLTKYGRWCEKL